MAAYFEKDSYAESDDSESAFLLSRSEATDPIASHKHQNQSRQTFDVGYTTNNGMPSGKRFILKSDAIYPSRPSCTIFVCVLLSLSGAWLLVTNAMIATAISYCTVLIALVFLIYYVTGICIYYKKEHWSTFIMIINEEENTFYVIDQSNYKKWEISSVGRVNNLNLSIEKATDTKAYVMMDQARFNTKHVRLEEAQKFIALIEEYVQGMWRNEYINEQYMNGDILEKAEHEDAQYDMNVLDNGLNQMIKGMMSANDVEKQYEGQKLDEWYHRENYGLLREYKQLIRQRDDERERFEKYMNFEPRFNEDYIAKMLLVKCNVME
eukprot:491100_1